MPSCCVRSFIDEFIVSVIINAVITPELPYNRFLVVFLFIIVRIITGRDVGCKGEIWLTDLSHRYEIFFRVVKPYPLFSVSSIQALPKILFFFCVNLGNFDWSFHLINQDVLGWNYNHLGVNEVLRVSQRQRTTHRKFVLAVLNFIIWNHLSCLNCEITNFCKFTSNFDVERIRKEGQCLIFLFVVISSLLQKLLMLWSNTCICTKFVSTGPPKVVLPNIHIRWRSISKVRGRVRNRILWLFNVEGLFCDTDTDPTVFVAHNVAVLPNMILSSQHFATGPELLL